MMSGGWFFVVASEAITVGDTTITLLGVGSYIAKANDAGDWSAIGAAVLTMAIVILLYDQLFSGRSSPGPTSSRSNCRRARSRGPPGC
jgi:ABC-type anion transport system duplicated permease subunit